VSIEKKAVVLPSRNMPRVLLALFYGVAGLAHLAVPDWFLPIVPDIVPFPYLIVLATGLCEISGALALFSTRLRRLAGAMLALYALCVWPANIKHALMAIETVSLPASWWYHAPRLALQPVLMWWALYAGGWFGRLEN
jgi:uncharacterized membrane protein